MPYSRNRHGDPRPPLTTTRESRNLLPFETRLRDRKIAGRLDGGLDYGVLGENEDIVPGIRRMRKKRNIRKVP